LRAVNVTVEQAPVVLAAAGSYGRGAWAFEVTSMCASSQWGVQTRREAVGRDPVSALGRGPRVGHQLALPSEMLALAKDDLGDGDGADRSAPGRGRSQTGCAIS